MKRASMSIIIPCLLAMLAATGCASTKVSNREELVTEKIPRPAHIWIYDLVATTGEVPAESSLYKHPEVQTPQLTPEEIAEGNKLGHEFATDLAADIRGVGMPAETATSETNPQINDIVIHGYLLSIQEGDAEKRVLLGFSSGASELKVAVEGFQKTAHGLRKLGGGNVQADGSKTPGAAVGVVGLIATHNPVGLIVSTGMKLRGEESGSSTEEGRAKQIAKEISDALKQRFQEQGWIQ